MTFMHENLYIFFNVNFYSIEVMNTLIWIHWYHSWCCKTNIKWPILLFSWSILNNRNLTLNFAKNGKLGCQELKLVGISDKLCNAQHIVDSRRIKITIMSRGLLHLSLVAGSYQINNNRWIQGDNSADHHCSLWPTHILGLYKIGCEFFLIKNFTGCERRMHLLIWICF